MDLEQCRVSEAEPMSKYGAMEMDCMKRFYVHSGSDTPIFIHLREQLHCQFHVTSNAGLKLSRALFPWFCSQTLFQRIGIQALLAHNFCFYTSR
jgi:hypothetical protein